MPNPHRSKEQEEKDRRERLAYVGALAAGLVHEVRTPLHAIQLNAQMLVEDVDKLPEEIRPRFDRRASRIYTEVKSLAKTLEAFLTFARPPRLDPGPTDLNRFLRELIEFVQPEMDEAGISIKSELASDLYPVVLDQNQFTHVVLNLLRNAKEAIEQRQEKENEIIEGVIRISTTERESQIDLLIEDNGIGIQPEDEEHIFEVFYTTKQKGTGLGLGIVRRIVEDHRGTISVIPIAPPGARFRITLPRGHFLEFRKE
jgi:signal transduction histidine kinase